MTSAAAPRGRSRSTAHIRRSRAGVEQPGTVQEARFQPLVVFVELAAAAAAGEGPAEGGDDRTPAMNSARSSANAAEWPGSVSVATVPGSHVCTDHGSG